MPFTPLSSTETLTSALMSNSRLTAALVFSVHYMITMTDLQVRAAAHSGRVFVNQRDDEGYALPQW